MMERERTENVAVLFGAWAGAEPWDVVPQDCLSVTLRVFDPLYMSLGTTFPAIVFPPHVIAGRKRGVRLRFSLTEPAWAGEPAPRHGPGHP